MHKNVSGRSDDNSDAMGIFERRAELPTRPLGIQHLLGLGVRIEHFRCKGHEGLASQGNGYIQREIRPW
jgi:hypothetical protein